MSSEPFELKEEDRDFVASILNEYANKMRKEMDNFPSAPSVGIEMEKVAARARNIARDVNPGKYHRGVLMGLTYPREKTNE